MTVTYVSNDINNHILFLCKSLYRILGNNFHFIATDVSITSQNAFQKGFAFFQASTQKDSITDPWYMAAINSFTIDECKNIINSSDVVIIANSPDFWIKERLVKSKLTFRAHERWYGRHDLKWYRYPRALFGGWLHHKRYSNLYMLCASAYTAADAAKVNCYKNKVFKWGYFPACKDYNNTANFIEEKNKKQILWCGRFLDWKHPDDAVKIAGKLRDKGYDFNLSFIGTGNMKSTLIQMIKDYQLEKYVTVFDAMQSKKVREYMRQAGIYLFTSDKQEGWGAVLNEAMNSGCAIVASHAIGAVPYLIKNNENGYVYKSGDIDELYNRVKYLLDDHYEQTRIGYAAYQTILKEWNAEIAAIRLINLSEHILNGEESPDLYSDGPCSKADILKDNWYHPKG